MQVKGYRNLKEDLPGTNASLGDTCAILFILIVTWGIGIIPHSTEEVLRLSNLPMIHSLNELNKRKS